MPNTILIVDDFRDYVAMLEKTLTAEGFKTLTAYDGKSAIEKARSEKPDLILLDIMMPDIGGTEVRVELMKDPATRNIPVLFLTGLRAPHGVKKSSSTGMKVIGKSGDFGELFGAIREMIGKPAKG